MSNAVEGATGKSTIGSPLDDGLRVISYDQVVSFAPYTRVVSPIDNAVFWCLAGPSKDFRGSLHMVTDRRQNEDELLSVNRIIFTAREEVEDLNEVSPSLIYIGTNEGRQFAFSTRDSFYRQADLWHYRGDAVYPALASQLVNSIGQITAIAQTVSNSLPIWLTLNKWVSMYPSYLVPANLVPPYCAVHIEPAGTSAMQAVAQLAPVYKKVNGVIVQPLQIVRMEHVQLMQDKVKLTVYGLNNDAIIGLYDNIIEYMTNNDDLGLMNMPSIKDDKRGQAELGIIAMKKTIDFEVSYYQSRAYECAKQLILSAIPSYLLQS